MPSPVRTDRAKAADGRVKEEMRMTRAAFMALVKYLEEIGISILAIENKIVMRSERIKASRYRWSHRNAPSLRAAV